MLQRYYLAPAVLFALLIFSCVLMTAAGASYNWDIDHMMYFGGRLLHGELVWTNEFDDKFPVVQLIFSIPSLLHSLVAWRLISVCVLMISALVFVLTMREILKKNWQVDEAIATFAAATGSTLFLWLIVMIPGSFSHINPLAASLFTIAACLRLRNSISVTHISIFRYWQTYASAFIFAIAISIRPYFLLPCVLVEVWCSTRMIVIRNYGREQGLFSVILENRSWTLLTLILWVGLIGVFGLAVNAMPYLVEGKLGAFVSGLELLRQKLNPQSTIGNLWSQMSSIMSPRNAALALIFGVIGLWIVIDWLSRHNLCGGRLCELITLKGVQRVDVIFGALVLPVLLEMTILMKHFWSHYFQMFVPFAAFGVTFLIGTVAPRVRSQQVRAKNVLLIVWISTVILSVPALYLVGRSINQLVRLGGAPHDFYVDLVAFRQYLDTRPPNERSFLSPSNIYLHWTLDESRHGFPHAANTGQIFAGWWERVRMPPGLALPTDGGGYCQRLIQTGPTIIVDVKGNPALRCFEGTTTPYVRDAMLTGGGGRTLVVYSRLKHRK